MPVCVVWAELEVRSLVSQPLKAVDEIAVDVLVDPHVALLIMIQREVDLSHRVVLVATNTFLRLSSLLLRLPYLLFERYAARSSDHRAFECSLRCVAVGESPTPNTPQPKTPDQEVK